MPEAGSGPERRSWRLAASLLGDVFLGIAIGLLGYYAVTNGVTAVEQQALQAQIPQVADVRIVPNESGSVVTTDSANSAEQDKAYWGGLAEGDAFGRLVIARIGLDVVVVKGVNRDDLMKGPGWIPTTSVPGTTGNVGIAGHRTTYLAPFRDVDQLQVGDTIEFYTPYSRYTYRVSRTLIVLPTQVDVMDPTPSPMLTLSACHPPFSAEYRMIVQSDLAKVERLAPASASK
ncbi:MAG: class E sortase [Coriobacteriia bacterium]|nr:class E sortase [Coriobacteriia bacterium]